MSAATVAPHPVDRLPRVSVAAAGVLGLFLSISPSSLPHGAILQGVVSALFVLMCVQAAGTMRRSASSWTGPAQVIGLLGVSLLAVAVGMWGDEVLDAARERAGLPPLGWRYWATVLGVVAVALLLRRAGQTAWRGRAWSRAVWRPTSAAVICLGLVLAGSPAHGAAPDDTMWVMQQHSPVGAPRAYARMVPGEGAAARAERSVDALVRDGGLRRSRIVIALPTGSGWINPQFLAGVEGRFGSDVATVSMQYDAAPSWWSLLVHRERSAEASAALFDEVTERVDGLPPEERPDLHVYGESLGADAGQALFAGDRAEDARRAVCSVLWVGPPGGSRAGVEREGVVANPDDPVVHTSWRDAVLPSGEKDWLPVVSSVHDVVDLVGSLEVPEGMGHRYGRDQAAFLEVC